MIRLREEERERERKSGTEGEGGCGGGDGDKGGKIGKVQLNVEKEVVAKVSKMIIRIYFYFSQRT